MKTPASNRIWDPVGIHAELTKLIWCRATFRAARTLRRLRSPRRIVATALSILLVTLYLINGVFILSSRQPADPQQLSLWLSGGMVIYALYHMTRCAWQERIAELEMTAAEKLWLGTAPLRRSALAVYHIGGVVSASLVKTLLLAVVLFGDVPSPVLLGIGIFCCLLLLDLVRLIGQRFMSALDGRGLCWARLATTSIAVAVAIQVVVRLAAKVPLGSSAGPYVLGTFGAIGDTAGCDLLQCLATPWWPGSQLAIQQSHPLSSVAMLTLSLAMIPAAVLLLIGVDSFSRRQQLKHERQRLTDYQRNDRCKKSNDRMRPSVSVSPLQRCGDRLATMWIHRERVRQTLAIFDRQLVSIKRYWKTIAVSMFVPVVLCLSPLATDDSGQQWFLVVGGIALCTMLLAPPALRLDFRRDLKRMLLLRSLPASPLSMVLGQLTLPVLITIAFQAVTLLIAIAVIRPNAWQALLWSGMLSALAVFTFAVENALFLLYPHHQRAQGIGMMIRAKLTFLGKACVIAASVAVLVGWAWVCTSLWAGKLASTAFVGGAIGATWLAAILSLAVTTWCWRRFDLTLDTPPE